MKIEAFREMSDKEKELVERLLSPNFPGRDELKQQLQSALVRTIDEDGGLEFLVRSATRVEHVKFAVPAEAEYEDDDGIIVHVLLHVSGDCARELEFFREDGSRVRQWPNTEGLRVFAYQ